MFLKRIRKTLRKSRLLFDLRSKLIRKKQTKKLHEVGYGALNKLNAVCEKSEIDICCAYGTLLGFVREGGFIGHDDDIDMMVINNEKFSWKKIETIMKENGFNLFRYFTYKGKVMEQTYEWNGITIDLFMFTPIEDGMIAYFFDRKFDVEYDDEKQYSTKKVTFPAFKGIEKKEYNGQLLYVPIEPDEWLEYWYGNNWRTPDPSFRPLRRNVEWMVDYGYVHT